LGLQKEGFPVPELLGLKLNAGTLLELEGFSYELCRFIEGRRFDGQLHDAKSSGSRLAGFHDLTHHYCDTAPPGAGFHGRADVVRAASELHKTRPELDPAACETLAALLDAGHTGADTRWNDLPNTVVHGDWHPGNLLFGTYGVNAVLDLETVRVEPRVSEIANALLQFSMPLRQGPNATARQLDAPSMELQQALLSGYGLVARHQLQPIEIDALPHIMIEALSVEAVIALHRKGRFGDWTGPQFLDFVCRRGAWITTHANGLRLMVSSA
jgi:Ser/Thr protein kinase RdoA (MazF antagonist)